MSTSCKSAFPELPAAPVEAFHYPEAANAEPAAATASDEGALFPAAEDEMAQVVMSAHSQGMREAEERARAAHAGQLEQERAKITNAVLHFQSQVAEYYSRMEVEIVQLALAIASKILHREAQTDSEVMGRIVKAILAKFHQNTKVRLHVPPEEVERWRRSMLANADAGMACEFLADSTLDPGECRLETGLGATEIGLAAQLKEIENGLFDLLAERPSR
jgi:flagellar assembly protein FliH